MTLPTHPLAVVGLKVWRPAWFDGVALVIGSMVPDFAYAEDGYGLTIHSHAWHAPLWWAVPLVLIMAPLVRWSAPAVAAHLPAGGPLRLRDYGALGRLRPPVWATVTSAIIGAASHIIWDAFAHPTIDRGRVLLPALHHPAVFGWPWWQLIANVSNAVGFVGLALFVWYLGRTRLLVAWNGEPPAVTRQPGRFWGTLVAVLGAGLATLPFQPAPLVHDQLTRILLFVGLAFVAGAAATKRRSAGPTRRTAARSRAAS
jgi:hypothetical protein